MEGFTLGSSSTPEDEELTETFSPEELAEADEIFRRAGMEIEARKKLDEAEEIFSGWYDQKRQEVEAKLKSRGIDTGDIEALLDRIGRDFVEEIRKVTERLSQIKAKLESVKPLIKINSEIESAYNWLLVSSPLAVADLLVRKLKGPVDEQSSLYLALLNLAEHGGTAGVCFGQEVDISSGKLDFGDAISLSLYNELSLDDYSKTLDHEVGHYISGKKARGAKDLLKRSNRESDNHPLFLMAGFLRAIDETYTHILGQRRPHFTAYGDKINSKLFELTYDHLVKKTEGMGEDEREDYFCELLNKVTALWREDLTKDEFYNVIVADVLVYNKM